MVRVDRAFPYPFPMNAGVLEGQLPAIIRHFLFVDDFLSIAPNLTHSLVDEVIFNCSLFAANIKIDRAAVPSEYL